MSSDKLNSIIENLKEEYLKLVIDKSSKFGADQMKSSLSNTVDKIHKELDEEAEELITQVVDYLQSYNLNVDKSKYIPKEDNSTEIAKDIKNKIKDLMSSLENMISVTSINEEVIEYFKTTPIEKLITIHSNRLIFKNIRISNSSIYRRGKKGGKDTTDYVWDADQVNYRKKCKIEEDGKLLKVNNSSCWNFTTIEPKIEEGLAELTLEGTNLVGDDHFYIGICNELKNLKTDSGCLCCSNPNSWYYDRAGKVSCDSTLDKGKIEITDKKNFNAKVIVDYDNMEISFEENDKTAGPFKIHGKSFKFMISSCNSYTGSVRILN